MDKVTAAAKQANGRSRVCNKCPVLKSNKACPEMYLNICTEAFVDGFKKGAKWKINSVWHDAKEKPAERRLCLFVLKDGYQGCGYYHKNDNTIFYERFEDVEKWAYVKDLLPIKN